jgi:hypothetical protein
MARPSTVGFGADDDVLRVLGVRRRTPTPLSGQS